MPTRFEKCPFCSSRKIRIEHFNGDYHGHCDRCGAAGPTADTWDEAKRLWNNRPERKTDGDGN